jgi:nucleotide-binding universal stress UspA family protein
LADRPDAIGLSAAVAALGRDPGAETHLRPYASNTFSGAFSLGSLNGPLHANNGLVSATSSIGVLYGGTGLTAAPSYGQLLVGNSSGGYTLTATSSLSITGTLTGTTGQLAYFSGTNTVVGTSSLFIATIGNVGIGTTTPLSKLSVVSGTLPDLLEEQFHRPTGTPDYMASEQLLRVRSDKRSDIYAFGAVLYQLATGHLPFGHPARMRKVRQRVWRDPIPPRALRPEIPSFLQEIILRCLEPLPDQRYQSATDLLFDLRHPDLVELTERSARSRQSDFKTTFRRRLRAPKTIRAILASATRPPARAPIVVAAVDLRPELRGLNRNLLEVAASVLANTPGARLGCVAVMPTSLIGVDENVDVAGENIHVQRLSDLRMWAQPLQLPRGKVTYHLLESRNVAAKILEFARSNSVDHIVIGAAPIGSYTAKVVGQITADAPCSVTVVRAGELD